MYMSIDEVLPRLCCMTTRPDYANPQHKLRTEEPVASRLEGAVADELEGDDGGALLDQPPRRRRHRPGRDASHVRVVAPAGHEEHDLRGSGDMTVSLSRVSSVAVQCRSTPGAQLRTRIL